MKSIVLLVVLSVTAVVTAGSQNFPDKPNALSSNDHWSYTNQDKPQVSKSLYQDPAHGTPNYIYSHEGNQSSLQVSKSLYQDPVHGTPNDIYSHEGNQSSLQKREIQSRKVVPGYNGYKIHEPKQYWPRSQCPFSASGFSQDKSFAFCRDECTSMSDCTAFHYHEGGQWCEHVNCPLPVPLPTGSCCDGLLSYSFMKSDSYYLSKQLETFQAIVVNNNQDLQGSIDNINATLISKHQYLRDQMNSSNLVMNSILESLEKKQERCPQTKTCTDAGGSCIKSRVSCNGTEDLKSCKGKKCKCCIPLQVPDDFEIFDGRVIRRTKTSDPKSNTHTTSMEFCDQFGAKPFIPLKASDHQLYKDVRASLTYNGYMWLPADDLLQEGTLHWYTGDIAENVSLWDWYQGKDLATNSESSDCMFYGTDGNGPIVHMVGCNSYTSYPPICEII